MKWTVINRTMLPVFVRHSQGHMVSVSDGGLVAYARSTGRPTLPSFLLNMMAHHMGSFLPG